MGDMTPTDEQHGQLDTGYPHTLRPELHKALMARGIDYWVTQGITFWNRDDGCECLAYGYKANGVPKLAIKVVGFTEPEQAIAATLGHEDTYTREDVESAFVSGYSLGSLPVGSDPRWDENRQTVDEHMAELGWVRKDTLGAGTCHNASKVMDEHGQARFACSECGAWIDSRMLWNPEYRNGESPWVSDCKLNFCPNCGRKVVGK